MRGKYKMIFAKRYEDLIFHGEKHEIRDDICGDVDYNLRVRLVDTMVIFCEPMILRPNRYDLNDMLETNAFECACSRFNDIMGKPYLLLNNIYILASYCLSFIFSVVELQYENLSDKEKIAYSLPYVRNNSGADHGTGAKEVVISKPMAKLSINLAAALNTYLIEEYAASKGDTN